ncbi:inactive protein RESTRICTED TEV MOVEMENT 2-like [Abrus precatorius]|uniref:Inactive protein RESTRICTED TEV MOVEMENT 2-like n=1 Tax=Abrus precatorius TaxID=3816 RepID=A0A8B8KCU6_ABRPR|nr:inactive protein RESTRICTED TEV MOVEMENT 2-like [Abrus precatorius]
MAQMDPRRHDASAADRVYEDFEPSYEWTQDEQSDVLILMLRGFIRENLKVQISSNRILKIRGEQQISDNKWSRFNKEFTIPPHSNPNGIKAKLVGGLLYITLAKSNTEVKPVTKSPVHEAPNHEAGDRAKPMEDRTEAKHESTEAPRQEEPKASEVSQKKSQKEKEQPSYDDSVVQNRAKATTHEAKEMHETIGGLVKGGEKKADKRLPTTLSGLVVEIIEQKKLANLLVIIFLILVMGICVKNAIKATFGGSSIQEF